MQIKKTKKDVTSSTDTIKSSNKYDAAMKHIMAAVDILASSGDDPIAKDSIANLGVVMFDLKGSKE